MSASLAACGKACDMPFTITFTIISTHLEVGAVADSGAEIRPLALICELIHLDAPLGRDGRHRACAGSQGRENAKGRCCGGWVARKGMQRRAVASTAHANDAQPTRKEGKESVKINAKRRRDAERWRGAGVDAAGPTVGVGRFARAVRVTCDNAVAISTPDSEVKFRGDLQSIVSLGQNQGQCRHKSDSRADSGADSDLFYVIGDVTRRLFFPLA